MIDNSKFANFVNNMSSNDMLQFMLNGFEPEDVREYYERLLDNKFVNKIESYNNKDSNEYEEKVEAPQYEGTKPFYDKELQELLSKGMPEEIADIIANLRSSGKEVKILGEYGMDEPDDCDCPACNVRREMFGSNDDPKSMKDILQNLLSQKSKKLN